MEPLFGPVPERGLLEILLMIVVGLGLPLAIAGLLGKVAFDRWRRSGPPSSEDETDASVSDKWWWLIAANPVGYLVLLAFTMGFVLLPYRMIAALQPLSFLFIGVLWLLHGLMPIAVYFDRKYLADVSDWLPSAAYFLVILPYAGTLLAAMYVYERHQQLGVP